MKVGITQSGGVLGLTTVAGDPIQIGVQVSAPITIDIAVPGSISGPTGPQGPQGEQGPPGQDGSGAQTYVFTQASPSTTWHITHNLGVFPAVVVVDSGGTVVEGSITHNSTNACTLTFSVAFAGTAYLI
jgi:hypothetical protein